MVIKFRHRYTKLNGIKNGDKARCIFRMKTTLRTLYELSPSFLIADCHPHLPNTAKLDDIVKFFRSFGYKNFDENTPIMVYFMSCGDKIFTTIRKPNKYKLGKVYEILINQY